jgi:hypothetical protein
MKFKLTHTTLYAKGWYKKSDDVWADLIKILELDNYTPFTRKDVYNILLGHVQECDFRWCELREVMIGIHPNECWKYGYYTKDNFYSFVSKTEKLPEYDMPIAFVYYVLSNLRNLDKNQWENKIPKWTKYPKNPKLTIKDLIEMFNKK